MKNLTTILTGELKSLAKWYDAGYWKISNNIFLTTNESIIIALIDSALDDTLIAYWSEKDQIWFHYTNCFGIGTGGDNVTRSLISEWFEKCYVKDMALDSASCGYMLNGNLLGS